MMSCSESTDCPLTPDQLDALADEIATFAARVDVAEHALLTRLRLFDSCEAWGPLGFLSCAHWLSWRVGVGLGTARERVRVARALADLPKVDALFGRGELSYSKVRAITRVATPVTEQELIDIALNATAAQLERLLRAYRRVVDSAGATGESERERDGQRTQQQRYVRRSETADGMTKIEMQLPPEEAAIVWDAIVSAADAAAEVPAEAPVEAPAEASAHVSAEARARASAREFEQRRADAVVDVARAYLAKDRPRTLGSGYELVLVTSKDQLEHGPGGVGGFLRDGTAVPLHVARALACDGARVDVTLGEHGELLDVGRRSRTIPSAIGRALWLRDGGSRGPGSERRHHLQAHHVKAWVEGGPTSLSNLVLTCPAHHRMIHEGELRVEVRGGELVFVGVRTGRELPARPPKVATGRELEQLERFLDEAGVQLGPSTNEPRWDGSAMNLAESLDWLLLAHT